MSNAALVGMRFSGMTESIGPMFHSSVNPWGVSRFPVGRCQGIRHAGKSMPGSSSAMSSGRLSLGGLLASRATSVSPARSE
jgi:hypothetical protein